MMAENLESQYEQVLEYIEQYLSFEEMLTDSLRKYMNSHRSLMTKIWVIQKDMKPLSGKKSELTKKIFIESATEDQKHNEFFAIFIGDYTLELLSTYLLTHCPQFDFLKLKKIHQLKEKRVDWDPFKYITGIYLAAGVFLLNNIPQSVVEPFFVYKTFEKTIFWMTVGSLVLLLIIFLPSIQVMAKAKRNHEFIDEVLTYISIKKEENSK